MANIQNVWAWLNTYKQLRVFINYVFWDHFSIFFILATISRKETFENPQSHQLRKRKHLKQNREAKISRQPVWNEKRDCSCCSFLISSSNKQPRAMPLPGALRHFFAFISCVMSTTSFVRKCPLPREDFLLLSYVLFIHIMVLLVRLPTPPWVLCLGLSKLLRTGKGPNAHKT